MILQLNEIAQIWWQWMGSMFWQVSLLIILVTALDMAIRRWAWPQVRYALWGLVFLKLIIPPTWHMPTSIVSWMQPSVERQIPIQIKSKEWTVGEIQISASNTSAQEQDKAPAVTKKPTWQTTVFLTWLVGMIAFAIMLTIKMSRLPKRSNTRDKHNAPEWFHDIMAKTTKRLNLKKVPAIVFSKEIVSPAIYGIFSPVLLLPEGYLDDLSEEQAEHVLIHELCHLKRGDVLVHWFCLLLQVIYWFNPLLIWTRRQMRHVCEICCDLSVANLLREKTTAYRDTLLATARNLLTESVEPSLGLLGIFEEPFRLVSRLKWLEKKTWVNRKLKIVATICTGIIMVVCVMPMAGISQTNSKNDNSEIQSGNHVKVDGQGTQDKDNALKPQFIIEVVVAEVDEEAATGLGIELQKAPTKDRMTTGAVFGEISDNRIIVWEKSFPDLKSAIEAMKMESGVHILAEPKVIVLDNKKATIRFGSSVIIPATEMEPKGNLSLEVTPQIQENGYILQEIGLKVSYQTGEESGVDDTVNRGINTTIQVQDGSTVVISGIRTPQDTIADEISSDRKELIIFLTSRVLLMSRIMNTKSDDYMIGVEYESDENLLSTIGSVTHYDTLIIEVDEDKELELDAEPIFPPTGSQIVREKLPFEENDHYAGRIGFNPGTKPDDGENYRVRVAVVRRDPYNPLNSEPPDLPDVPDVPPDNYYMLSRDAVDTEAPASPLSISLFKDDITINGESFPDIGAVVENMETEAGVNILGTPRTITLDDEDIKMSWNIGYDKTSTVSLGISSRVINGGEAQKSVSLNINLPLINGKAKDGFSMRFVGPLTAIEEGGAMVMIVDPFIEDPKAEQDNATGKKLYVFLAPHVEEI